MPDADLDQGRIGRLLGGSRASPDERRDPQAAAGVFALPIFSRSGRVERTLTEADGAITPRPSRR